jgi:hypothetical protein
MKNNLLKRITIPLVALLTLVSFYFMDTGCGPDDPSTPTQGAVSIFYGSRNPYDNVDSGKHLDYDVGDSKYSNYVTKAAAIWNGYRPGVIRADSLTVVEDVLIKDVNGSVYEYAGYTDIPGGTIYLNRFELDNSSKNPNGMYTLKVVAHELGHALGLAHNDASTANIMKQGSYKNETLTIHDKASYDAAYTHY